MLTDFNLPESAVALDASTLCRKMDSNANSAIDDFYSVRDVTLSWAYKDPFVNHSALRDNLLLLLFSAAESYFRRVISEILAICPVAAETAAQHQVPLGAISALGLANLGLAIADTKGLTSAGEIPSRTRSLLGIVIDKNSSLDVALGQFEKICTFRHSIVHSSGELLYTNRRDLKVGISGRLAVELNDKSIQDVVQLIVNAVRAYNNHVANRVLERWFVGGHLCGDWGRDKDIFVALMGLFSSKIDGLPAERFYYVYIRARKKMRVVLKKQAH